MKKLGHDCDKVEFVVMGGTFMSLPADYRDYFISNCFDYIYKLFYEVFGLEYKVSMSDFKNGLM